MSGELMVVLIERRVHLLRCHENNPMTQHHVSSSSGCHSIRSESRELSKNVEAENPTDGQKQNSTGVDANKVIENVT